MQRVSQMAKENETYIKMMYLIAELPLISNNHHYNHLGSLYVVLNRIGSFPPVMIRYEK